MKTYYLKKRKEAWGEHFVKLNEKRSIMVEKNGIQIEDFDLVDDDPKTNLLSELEWFKKNWEMEECTHQEFDVFYISTVKRINEAMSEDVNESAFDDSFITEKKMEEIKKDPIMQDFFNGLNDVYNERFLGI